MPVAVMYAYSDSCLFNTLEVTKPLPRSLLHSWSQHACGGKHQAVVVANSTGKPSQCFIIVGAGEYCEVNIWANYFSD